MALIDLSNYNTLLHQSDASRGGAPTGNIYFDPTANAGNGAIEFIDATELANYTPSAATGSISLEATAGGTFIRTTGSFTADGFRAGMNFTATGFVSGGNNSTFEIASISTDGLTITVVDNTGMASDASAGSRTLSGASTPNSLLVTDGLRMEAVYAFENQERSLDEDLRKFDRWTSGTFKFGGAYNFINARTPSTDADRKKLRSSGWNELAANGNPTAIWFGSKGLSNIEATSTPYYQLSVQGTSVDADKTGQIDEAVRVYRDDNADGTPDEDNRTYLAWSIRTYGQNPDRKESTTDLGITELGGYFTGYALNESVHLTTSEGSYPIANVYNPTRASQVGVWQGMQLERIASPTAKTGEFSDETGTRLFRYELRNDNGADLYQCVAWLDAFSLNTDEADGLGVTTGNLGKDIETWYYYDANGRIITQSGVDNTTEGMYINNIPVADQQLVRFTDDSGVIKAYSFTVSVEAEVGSVAKADPLAWYHSFFSAAYNSAGAITVQDNTATEVKGLASTADGANKIIFGFDYTGDTIGGTANTDKAAVFLCEGDGGATQAKTLYNLVEQTTVAFPCIPLVENNV